MDGDTQAIRAALDAIDAAHQAGARKYATGEWSCLCGVTGFLRDEDHDQEFEDAHAAHVRDVTAEAVGLGIGAALQDAVPDHLNSVVQASYCEAGHAAFLAALRGTK